MDKTSITLFFTAGAMLLIGALPLPYSYYILLYGVVCTAAVALFLTSIKMKSYFWMLLAIPSLVLWFPLFEIENSKQVWIYFDLVFGSLFFTAGLFFQKHIQGQSEYKYSK